MLPRNSLFRRFTKFPQKIVTRSSWILTSPDSFNLYFFFYIVNFFKSTITSIHRPGKFKILVQSQEFNNCWLRWREMKYLALPRCLPLPPGYPIYSTRLPYTSLPYIFNNATLHIQQNGNLSLVLNEGSKTTDLSWLIFNDKDILDISLVQSNVFWKASISVNEWYFEMGITKPCTHLHPAPSTSTQLISASTQLSATPSTIFEPKYCT